MPLQWSMHNKDWDGLLSSSTTYASRRSRRRDRTLLAAWQRQSRFIKASTPDTDAVVDAVLERPVRIVVAEDDDEMRTLLASALRRDGYEVIEVNTGDQLLHELGNELLQPSTMRPDLIVSDIRMPGCTGIEVLAGLRRADWATPVILITAFPDGETHSEATRLGATVFDKPFDIDDLRTAVVTIVGEREHA